MTAAAILDRADDMARVNNWIGAEPLFEEAELMFAAKGWLKPKFVAQIGIREWRPDGHLRHATFLGLLRTRTRARW